MPAPLVRVADASGIDADVTSALFAGFPKPGQCNAYVSYPATCTCPERDVYILICIYGTPPEVMGPQGNGGNGASHY